MRHEEAGHFRLTESPTLVRLPASPQEWTIHYGPPPNRSGVYLFVIGDEVLYVGQSLNIAARIAQHNLRDIAGVKVGWSETGDQKIVEQQWIAALQPRFNGKFQERIAWAMTQPQADRAIVESMVGMIEIECDGLRCQRCGYEWIPRLVDRLPVVCARCRNRKWQQPK